MVSEAELAIGIPVFLDQLGVALRRARSTASLDHEQMSFSAARHEQQLFAMGLTVAQVVRDYGDVCQVITLLAIEQNMPIGADEFRTLSLCLDDAVAGAVTELSRQRERIAGDAEVERLGMFAHELRNSSTAPCRRST